MARYHVYKWVLCYTGHGSIQRVNTNGSGHTRDPLSTVL